MATFGSIAAQGTILPITDLAMKRQEANDFRVRRFGSAEMIAFICECADEDCKRSVLLSPDSYRARRESGEAILYPGHVPSADTPMAAERESSRQVPDSPIA